MHFLHPFLCLFYVKNLIFFRRFPFHVHPSPPKANDHLWWNNRLLLSSSPFAHAFLSTAAFVTSPSDVTIPCFRPLPSRSHYPHHLLVPFSSTLPFASRALYEDDTLWYIIVFSLTLGLFHLSRGRGKNIIVSHMKMRLALYAEHHNKYFATRFFFPPPLFSKMH